MNAVANITSSTPLYMPTPATNAVNINLSQISQDQLNSLLHQLQIHARASEPAVPFKHASITENDYMASQSSAGNVSFPFPSSSLHFQNHCLTFQHQCLSTLQNTIPNGAWIIDIGATMHVI